SPRPTPRTARPPDSTWTVAMAAATVAASRVTGLATRIPRRRTVVACAATTRAEADFDHNSLEWLARRHANNAELRATSPVIWNRRHRFWFVTGHEEVAAVARDN